MKAPRRETVRLITHVSAGTLELGMSVAIGAGIGYALDTWLGTGPWMTLFWLVCGVIAGFRSLVRVLRNLERAEAQKEDDADAP
ncbi:MAG: AtpZ/AtpI family protein [Candidatus Dadabacteria bacterium]|nr:MAG: AtpZ/AtpI family protein [Candidatus Dadabacteria bacterium]